jgi:hypothetical protein
MTATTELLPEVLYRRCKPDDLPFETTAELDAGIKIPGQARAAEALQSGLVIDRAGRTSSHRVCLTPWPKSRMGIVPFAG